MQKEQLMLHTRIFTFNPIETNCVVAWLEGSPTCMVADPGMFSQDSLDQLLRFFAINGLMPDAVFLTHGHFDHTWGVKMLVEHFPGIPVYMNPADKAVLQSGPAVLPGREKVPSKRTDFPTVDIVDGQVITSGGVQWKAIFTPGHTPGGVCWWCEEHSLLLSGDTLFAGSIGRTDLIGGDYDVLMKSLLEKVMLLPGETDVIPGHGQPTSIVRESASNPFLHPFNEPEGDSWWEQDGIPIKGNTRGA